MTTHDPIERTLRAAGWTETTVNTGPQATDLYLIDGEVTRRRIPAGYHVGADHWTSGRNALQPPLPAGTIARSTSTGIVWMRTHPDGDHQEPRWTNQYGSTYYGELPDHFRIVYDPSTDTTHGQDPTT